MGSVIAGYSRSPFTRAMKGELARIRPDDIAAKVVNSLISNLKLDPNLVEDIIVGTFSCKSRESNRYEPRNK